MFEHAVMLLTVVALFGCGPVPAELAEARSAYVTSINGPAAEVAPADLYKAHNALYQATREFDAKGNTRVARDYSYIASRRIELAEVRTRTEMDRRSIAEAVRQGVVPATGNTAVALTLDPEQSDAGLGAQAPLAVESQSPGTAETRLAAAMKGLETVVGVKDESRGLVLTLSVLFATGRFTLLETARLGQVAEALKAQLDDKVVLVEGHTDSQGSDAINLPLSLNRAKAVRDYLVLRGVDADKIGAVGLGSTRPLLDNSTPVNRADNRRVEIIVKSSRLSVR